MIRYRLCLVVVTVVLLFIAHHPVNASTSTLLDKQGVQQLLEDTYDAQYSLTERFHTWEDAWRKMTQYMTEQMTEQFMVEHLYEEEEGYIVYGTDFSTFIIPHFSYNADTKMVTNDRKDTIFVYEKSSGDGPVKFQSQFDIVTITYDGERWKIASISFSEELSTEIQNAKNLESANGKVTMKSDSMQTYFEAKGNHFNLGYLNSMSVLNEHTYSPFKAFVHVIPYNLIFSDFRSDEFNSTFLTLSTIFSVKGEVQ
ncbi:hypothetical protein JOC85_000323 [Bacillus mesophilus]|uniref:DUF3993 domain-containing protein n=1 Tax=Bacillus mesophilus TaxID=1808955 RepID=A0A6M0Q2B9_9BACI|nr:DUF3993 domain-containing protein [Bacillus mesophilus]MBM7659556.1 hypothetical protein [Bacillus mesophilus]NEY70427.1 DUF3993 domain-containing protein [Bacillus mesophilus]